MHVSTLSRRPAAISQGVPDHPAPEGVGRVSQDDSPQLRDVFRGAVSSVWVITCAGERGPVGMTALSVVSVSLEPPLVSFNISRTSSSLADIARTRRVALHLLAHDQEAHVSRFAGDRSRRFVDDGAWGLDAEGIPCLHGVAARLVADVVDLHPAGDSVLALARVTGADQQGATPPLAHHDGAVHHIRPASA